jgi:hypothetical protein
MKYGIIFWLTDRYSEKVLSLQQTKTKNKNKEKVIRLIFWIKGHASCRKSFKAHKILTMASIYILKILCFIKIKSYEY